MVHLRLLVEKLWALSIDNVTQNCYKRVMTTNAYLFMWNCYGIESIVPITQYEDQMKLDAWVILKGETPGKNPIDDIVGSMSMQSVAMKSMLWIVKKESPKKICLTFGITGLRLLRTSLVRRVFACSATEINHAQFKLGNFSVDKYLRVLYSV